MKERLLDVMRCGLIIILLSFTVLICFSPAISGEREALRALETVKGYVEAGVSYKKFLTLLADARVEVNILRRQTDLSDSSKENEKKRYFFSHIESCWLNYYLAALGWKILITEYGEMGDTCSITSMYRTSEGKKVYRLLFEIAPGYLDEAYKVR